MRNVSFYIFDMSVKLKLKSLTQLFTKLILKVTVTNCKNEHKGQFTMYSGLKSISYKLLK